MALLISRKGQQRSAGGLAPDLAAALARADRDTVATVEDPSSVAAYRSWFDEYSDRIAPLEVRPKVKVQDLTLDNAAQSVPVRLYQNGHSQSVIVFAHGGGWVMGSLETHDHICRWLAAATQSLVISVDYGLSPEHPYPHAVGQVAEVIRQVQAERDLNRGLPIFVAGDSSGANVAAMATLALTTEERRSLAGFVSLYGAYAPRVNLSSHMLFAEGTFGLSRQQMLFFWNLYAPHIEIEARQKITPLGCDIDYFPPTLCIAAEYDLLLDDTLALYSTLASIGADVTLSLWPGLNHGCLHFVERVSSVTAAAQSIVQYVVARRSTQADSTMPNMARLLDEAEEPGALQLPILEDVHKLAFDKVPLINTPHLVSRSRQHGSITHKLGNAIIGGIHQQGALIPTEEEIGLGVNVSRNAYREAVRTLAAKGLVAATPKVGTKVAPRSSWRFLDPDVLVWHFEAALSDTFLRSLFELRKVIEPSAAALTAIRLTPEARVALAETLSGITQESVHSAGWNASLLGFHRLVLQGGNNELLSSFWPSLEVALQWQANLASLSGEAPDLHDSGADYAVVFDRLVARDAEGAMTEMAYLIDASLANAYALLERLQASA